MAGRALGVVTAAAPVVWLAAAAGCGASWDRAFCDGTDAECDVSADEWARLSSLGCPPNPPPDRSNRYSGNEGAVRLGYMFYFDPAFSGVARHVDAIGRRSPSARAPEGQPINVSCATCHDLRRGGVDVTSAPGHVSVGSGWTDVNALPTLNAAYRPVVFWNGRADSLWALNAIVAESPTTMNGNRLRTAHIIFDRYRSGYEAVFGPMEPAIATDPARFPPEGKPKLPGGPDGAWETMNPDDQNIVTRILVNWSKAIAAYEERLLSRDSPFDRFVGAGAQSAFISADAKRGARLFVGKASCVTCHRGPMFTDDDFHNVGVPQAGLGVPTTADCPSGASCDCQAGKGCAPWGAYEGMARLSGSLWRRTAFWSDDRSDVSRRAYYDRAGDSRLKGAWRTPSLRDVALTAPYMHDGFYATLREVVEHYNRGGGAGGDRVGDPAVALKPLGLDDDEVSALVAFLESLTGAPASYQGLESPAPQCR